MKRTIILVTAIILMSVAGLVSGQTENTFTTPDGSITLNYPADWVTSSSAIGIYEFANTPDQERYNPNDVETGTAFMQIITPPALEVRNLAVNSAVAPLINLLAENLAEDTPPAVETLEINGRPAARVQFSIEESDILLAGIEFQGGTVLMLAVTAPGEYADWRDTFDAMLNSITYSIPEAPELATLETITTENLDRLQQLQYLSSRNENVQLLGAMLNTDGTYAAIEVNGVAGGPDDSVRMINTITGERLWDVYNDYPDLTISRRYLGFVDDDQSFAVHVNENDEKFIWYIDIATGEVTEIVPIDAEENGLSAYGNLLVTKTNNLLQIKSRTSGEIILEHPFPNVLFAKFTSDGQSLVICNGSFGTKRFEYYVVDVANPAIGEPIITQNGIPQNINSDSPILSPDGNLLAVGQVNGSGIYVFDLSTGETVFELQGSDLSSEEVSNVRFDALYGFSVDGTTFFYMTNEGITYVVDLASGKQLTTLNLSTSTYPERFAISDNGKIILSMDDEDITIWGVRSQ